MERSKLPKLRQPTSARAASETKNIPATAPKPKIEARKLRRSKSVSDIRVGISKNFTFGTTHAVPKVPSKRPATSKQGTDLKPKVTKQAKIPEWDYKSRFQNLNEKHTKLLEAHKSLKDQCAGFDQQQVQLKMLTTEHSALEKKYDELIKKYEDMSSEMQHLKTVEKELNDLKVQLKTLKESNTEIISTNKKLLMKNEILEQDLCRQQTITKSLETLLAEKQTESLNNDILRRKLHNTIQDLKGNIRVFCRVRPPVGLTESGLLKCSINYPDEACLALQRSNRKNVNENKQEFVFDFVFPEETTQAEFFEELAQLVQSAIDGYHVCVFAYGQTGSGKTYTMQGGDTEETIGVIPRTVNHIFNSIECLIRSNWVYTVKVSFLEIYNENLRDLLDPDAKNQLDIHFNEGKGITVSNLRIEEITSYNEFLELQNCAQRNRMVAATNFNEHSSRSHVITKIYLTGVHKESKNQYIGSINLVDLAGSESAKSSIGDRLVETKSINRSLSQLGTVMLALHNKDKHIPYRNSKLTYLLQSCLGGNSKTIMIVNISPFDDHYLESINSLRFASSVKKVKTKFKRNKTVLSSVNV